MTSSCGSERPGTPDLGVREQMPFFDLRQRILATQLRIVITHGPFGACLAMVSIFAAHRLGRKDTAAMRCVQRGFMLVSLAWPDLPQARWHEMVRYYRGRAPAHAGLVLIEDRRGYVHAVFRYVVDMTPSLRPGLRGGVLRVQDLVMADLAGREVVAATRLGVAELAQACGCQVVILDPGAGLSCCP